MIAGLSELEPELTARYKLLIGFKISSNNFWVANLDLCSIYETTIEKMLHEYDFGL